MKLTARVLQVSGGARLLASGVREIAPPVRVAIEPGSGGYYLFRYGTNGKCLADTWHETVDAAKHQAELEYAIAAADWSPEA